MKILLLGGYGMAGHMTASYLRTRPGCELTVTVRPETIANRTLKALEGLQVRELDVRSFEAVQELVHKIVPDVIVNAVGILNHHAEDRPLDAYKVNGLLPHWLRHLGDRCGARLIHISSDCVFSGERGGYVETDEPDGTTVYAKTKALGEMRSGKHVTVRTSIIGPDDKPSGIGLMKWFLACEGEVRGYRNVLWNGVTTLELAKAIEWLIRRPEIGGLVHLTAPETVSKHELLLMMQEKFDKRNVTVVPVDEPVIDRTLTATRDDFDYRPPRYAEMLEELRGWTSSL
ncbi:dTDP-4-dehydrorhamnose reductase family protein [Cohnella phaseoli]|uniref:dTDP-4-dehydrorhamnose reductase n=1 Tax=Cohnella phaseoli TaxID=456490 RepID=A0A3D9JNG4_9BACL|nr:SDR family oxidoreductase [Cohnella phaseoli]RED75548.1 dTDP-4-dehydrorhamnose reductase [Cohnella phaseoli]